MEEGKALEVRPAAAIASVNPEALIAQAIEKGLPVETMERLLLMRTQLKEEAARDAYVAAMAKCQSELPIVEKTKPVKDKNGTIRYHFAPIDSIVEQCGPIIARNGLSYSFETEQDADSVKAICVVTHELGHTKPTSLRVPIQKDSYMNEPQKVASALTFAKRYAFCNAFGIMTGDEDDDAQASGEPKKAVAQAASGSPDRPASDKQKNFAKGLARSKGSAITDAEIEKMNSQDASALIEKLKALPDKPAAAGATATDPRDRLVELLGRYGMPVAAFEEQLKKTIVQLSEKEAEIYAGKLSEKIAAGEKYDSNKGNDGPPPGPMTGSLDEKAQAEIAAAAFGGDKKVDVAAEFAAPPAPAFSDKIDDLIARAKACETPGAGAALLDEMTKAGLSPTKVGAIRAILDTRFKQKPLSV